LQDENERWKRRIEKAKTDENFANEVTDYTSVSSCKYLTELAVRRRYIVVNHIASHFLKPKIHFTSFRVARP